eukprot:gene10514-3036_t
MKKALNNLFKTKKRRYTTEVNYQPKYNIVVVDVETTGLSPQNDRIIEIAGLKIVDGIQVGMFSSLVNPSIEISDNITNITKITQNMIDKAPKSREVLFQFSQFLGNNNFLAHNATFDSTMIINEMNRYGIPLSNCFKQTTQENNTSIEIKTNQTMNNDSIILNQSSFILCTLKLCKRLFPGLKSYSLENLSKFFNLNSKTFHRALSDVQITAKIFQ